MNGFTIIVVKENGSCSVGKKLVFNVNDLQLLY